MMFNLRLSALALAILLVASSALAVETGPIDVQVAKILGLEVEFCSQEVGSSDVSLLFGYAAGGVLSGVSIGRSVREDDYVFDPSGSVGEERAYFTIDGRTVLYRLDGMMEVVRRHGGREYAELFTLFADGLLHRMLRAQGDIQVRFVGPRGEADFTIPRVVLDELRRGFGAQCM